MFHALAGTKRATNGWLFYRDLRTVELLAARRKEFGNVVDGVVFGAGISAIAGLGPRRSALLTRNYTLVLIFIAVMPLTVILVLVRRCGAGARCAQLFQ